MTNHPTTSGSSIPGGAGSQSGFPRQHAPIDGPATVINPERRGRGSTPPAPAIPVPAGGSSLWTRLFPHETAPDNGLPPSPVGCSLGHFQIEAAIGSGGMGAVFRATDERLDRIVALKVLSPALARDQSAVQRFVNEARAAARLDHDNIARVFYVGEHQGLHFIAHEFVTGQNVRDLIREHGPLEPRDAVNFTLQIATALRHTAAAGVVHRDIKPSNIIVNPQGRAKLVDLGLAKKVASESFGDLTIAGTTLGTFDYISPEQAKDPRNVDVRSDIYSLGCTLYHMLTGEPPYPEGTVLQKLLDHQAKDVPDPARKNPRTPPVLAAVVRRMMAADPRERYATPDDLILELLPIAAQMGLRGINPEGLVWTSQVAHDRTFLERNLAWIVFAAALLLFALLVDRFPDKVRKIRTLNESGDVARDDGPRSGRGSADSTPNENPFPAEPSALPTKPAAPKGTAAPPGVARNEPRPPETRRGLESNSVMTADRNETKGQIGPLELTDPEKLFNDSISVPSPSSGGNAPTVRPGSAGSTAGSDGSIASKSPNGEGRGEPATAGIGSTGKNPPAKANPTLSSNDIGKSLLEGPVATRSSEPAKTAATEPESSGPEISISEGGATTPYPTLEAAVADAKEGNSIELRFNGPRTASEKPLRVSGKHITIRAAKGFHPVISFVREAASATYENRMITLVNGRLELVDTDIVANVPESTSAERWSLFSLGPADRLTLRAVNVTVTNPGNRQADVIDVSSNRDQMPVANRQAGPMGAPQEFEVEIERSFLRGASTLFAVRTTEAGRLDVKQSAAAVQGALLLNWGDDDSPGEGKRLSLRLEHTTCLLGGGLLSMDAGEVPRFLLPVDVSVRNNIFATNSAVPLIALTGRGGDEDVRRLVRWEGSRNFYDRFTTYWSSASANAVAKSMPPLGFEDWKHLFDDKEVDANNSGIAWKQSWQQKPFATIDKADFELASPSKAVFAATDGSDAGVDLAVIRAMPAPATAASEN